MAGIVKGTVERKPVWFFCATLIFEKASLPQAAAAKELNDLRENWLHPPEWTRTEDHRARSFAGRGPCEPHQRCEEVRVRGGLYRRDLWSVRLVQIVVAVQL